MRGSNSECLWNLATQSRLHRGATQTHYLISLSQSSPMMGSSCMMIWGGAERNKVHRKCNILESSWIHPPSPPPARFMEKLSFMKPVSDAKKVRDHCSKLQKGKLKAQLCLTLCDPMDYTVHGILQARILEWIVFPSPGDLPNPGIEPRSPALWADSLPAEPQWKPKKTAVGSLFLLQQIFLAQESSWRLLQL